MTAVVVPDTQVGEFSQGLLDAEHEIADTARFEALLEWKLRERDEEFLSRKYKSVNQSRQKSRPN